MAGTPSAKRTVETSLLLTGAAMIAFGAGVPAQAQETEAQGQETEEASRQVQTLDGVVVTARKRDELAQEVPMSVSAIDGDRLRSEEHTSELQSLMSISYAVFCLK